MGKTEDAVNELRSLLDTFYNDLEGWLELADIYSSCCQYVVILPSFVFALVEIDICHPLVIILLPVQKLSLSPSSSFTSSASGSSESIHFPPICRNCFHRWGYPSRAQEFPHSD